MRLRDLTCTGVGLWVLLYAAALGLPTRALGDGLDPVTVELGKHRLSVPGYNAQLIRRTPGWERGLSGLDKESGITLLISNEAIQRRIPAYRIPEQRSGSEQEALIVGVASLTAEEVARYKYSRSYAARKWDSNAGPAVRIVETVPGADLYRVYTTPKRAGWSVVAHHPDCERAKCEQDGDFWIAQCDETIGTDPSCFSVFVLDDWAIVLELHLAEHSLPVRLELAAYLKELLESWMEGR